MLLSCSSASLYTYRQYAKLLHLLTNSANCFLIWAANPEDAQRDSTTAGAVMPAVDALGLARAISISSFWEKLPDAVIVVRTTPRPALGVIGSFDAESEALLAAYSAELNQTLPYIRYVDYAQVEEDCERLAAQLLEKFSHDEVLRFRFTGIPRGGLIVLGMLAYMLDLDHTQLELPASPEVPLVVVDDCALTGSRFGRFLECCQSQQIIFAHLYSHPDLRVSIETREPSVVSCLGARDLHDHAPEQLGTEYAAWQKLWAPRAESHSYWVGQTDHLCFPWNEPDRAVWNPVTKQVEKGWPTVEPKLCLKNRSTPGIEPIPVQVQPQGKGQLRPAPHVLFGEFKEHIVISDEQTGTTFGLNGVAADMWSHLVRHGNLETASEQIAKEYGIEESVVQTDLRDFVDELLTRALLEPGNAPAIDT